MIDPNVRGCSTCSCGARIAWAESETTGRPMPFNAEPDPAGEWRIIDGKASKSAAPLFDAPGTLYYRPHWPDCPDAEKHRSAAT